LGSFILLPKVEGVERGCYGAPPTLLLVWKPLTQIPSLRAVSCRVAIDTLARQLPEAKVRMAFMFANIIGSDLILEMTLK
jgi:hypothetical protein